MADHILDGAPPVPLVLRKSARARRITLRVSAVDGQVTVTMPRYASERQALEFAELKADWIRGHLRNHRGQEPVGWGQHVPVDGVDRLVQQSDVLVPVLTDTGILLPEAHSDAGCAVEAWLKSRARKNLTDMVQSYAAQLGQQATAVTVRDTRSRWGSCTSAGRIMLSWRLAMAPKWVQAYVAAHEAAHLVEMNHSEAFWDRVAELFGDHTAPRHWLNAHGIELHRYKFRV